MKEKTNLEQNINTIDMLIPVGRHNAVSRKWLCSASGLNDRSVRAAISESNRPIINNGYGYFIPDLNDEIDIIEMHAYVAQERARTASLNEKVNRKFGIE